MVSRLILQYILEDILGNTNVYYNPPETLARQYPAIEYVLDGMDIVRADNVAYTQQNKYKITIISTQLSTDIIAKLLALPMCVYDRHYTSDGLHHDVLQLYY